MVVPPPSPDDNPSTRYTFEGVPPTQSTSGMKTSPHYRQQPEPQHDQSDSLSELVLDTLDGGLGITNRLFGCSWWLITLPFRIIVKLIGAFLDIF